MELLDSWREEDDDTAAAPPEATLRQPWDEELARTGGRSECWESLLVQIQSAETTNSFVFSDRQLDGVGAVELTHYLRDKCRAKFVDVSRLGRWADVSLAAAASLRHGLRGVRGLALDGNDICSCPEALEAWCAAIEEHPGLQRLSLRDTKLDDRAAKRLADALKGHSVLFSVDVGSNRIGDTGVEALTGALTENLVLLELEVQETDASEAARRTLEAVLERNRARFGGSAGCAKTLQGLRRARAEAVTALARGAARTPAVASALTRHGDISLAFDASLKHLSTAVEVGPGNYTWLPIAPSIDDALRAEALDEADGVFFDASEGITQELALRCEAGWRYTAAEAEGLNELRRTVADLKVQRRQERDRAEEARVRIAGAQTAFRERAAPVESEIIRMKEELASEIESTKHVLQERIRGSLLLRGAEEELGLACEERHHAAVTAQKLESSLKLRHREVDEEAEGIRAQVLLAEDATAKLEQENEVFRRRLHAARFETEAERFVPRTAAATVDC